MASQAQAVAFTDIVLSPEALLERSIEWIAENLGPQEVYDREQLDSWARLNGYVAPAEE